MPGEGGRIAHSVAPAFERERARRQSSPPRPPWTNARVRGVKNLRIADASIFPELIGVNPCLTCMVIGERAAELIHNELQAPPATQARDQRVVNGALGGLETDDSPGS